MDSQQQKGNESEQQQQNEWAHQNTNNNNENPKYINLNIYNPTPPLLNQQATEKKQGRQALLSFQKCF